MRSIGKMDGMKMSTGFLKAWRARVAVAALMGFGAATSAAASTFGFTGGFAVDNETQAFVFTVANDGDAVEMRNWGYGSGTFSVDSVNGGGAGPVTISSGNFDARLSLFDSAGNFMTFNENTNFPLGPPLSTGVLNALAVNYVNGASVDTAYASYDPELRLTLNAGTYTLILSQYENSATGGVSAPFSQDAAPDYTTTDPSFANQCAAGYFCDQIAYDTGTGYNRGGEWAVDFMGVASASAVVAAVPVPAALPLLAVAIGAMGFLRTRKRA